MQNHDKITRRDAEHRARVKKVARITGYEEDTVQKVTADVRKNDLILATYMAVQEGELMLENMLIEEVQKLVPFDLPSRLNTH